MNVYFTGDPIGPADRPEWEREVAKVKAQLGLTRAVPNVIEVYLPAFDNADTQNDSDEICEKLELRAVAHSSVQVAAGFELWATRWMDLARFGGAHLTDPAERIKEVLELWDAPAPGSWMRGVDHQLHQTRYRRGDVNSPHAGEHSIEYEILSQLDEVHCLDGDVVDGVNAMPFVRDETGGRRGNVEGDLYLLMKKHGTYHLVVCEVKHSANTSWYAAIESLRQLKLLHLSAAAQQLFHHRNRNLSLPAEIPIIGLVVAPEQYYTQPGQRSNVLPHAIRLLSEFTTKTGIEAFLAVWDPNLKVINQLPRKG